jgi:hypothetical protein
MEITSRVTNCSDYQFTSIVALVFESVAVGFVVPTIIAVKIYYLYIYIYIYIYKDLLHRNQWKLHVELQIVPVTNLPLVFESVKVGLAVPTIVAVKIYYLYIYIYIYIYIKIYCTEINGNYM